MSHFGAGCRDRLLAAARAAGCPIFSSTSGNGAHILARLAASADGVDLGRSMTLPAAGDPGPDRADRGPVSARGQGPGLRPSGASDI